MIENPRTGEQVEFVSDSPEVLVLLTRWTRPGHRALEHAHPGMEERWEVLEGRAAFRIDGVEVEAAAGSVVVAPAGSTAPRVEPHRRARPPPDRDATRPPLAGAHHRPLPGRRPRRPPHRVRRRGAAPAGLTAGAFRSTERLSALSGASTEYDLGAMSVLVLTLVIAMLLPVAVLAAMAVRLAYDDWSERRALRGEAARAEALRQAASPRRLVALDGEGGKPSDEERPGKTA